MGAVMHFQRTLNRFSRENVPGYLAVFIGGFGDIFAGCLSRVEKGFPGFLPGVAYATAYYHWDGGGCGVFFDRCGKIAVELEELEQPARVSTPAAAMTLIREIKVLRFIVGFPFLPFAS